MHFDRLRMFLAVAEHRSFTKAARALYISHSTTSRSVAALEAELGVPLFVREGRSVYLTAAGELLQKEGTQLVDKALALENAVRNTGKGAQGRLTISARPVWSPEIADACRTFCREYPEVSLELYSHAAADTVTAVLEGDADLGLSFSFLLPEQDTVMQTRRLSGEKFCVVVPMENALAAARSIKANELTGERFILVSPGQPERALLPHAAEIRYAPTAESVFLQVRSGNGISIVPRPLAYEYGDGCALLELDGADTDFDMLLFWRKDNANPSLKLFLDSL